MAQTIIAIALWCGYGVNPVGTIMGANRTSAEIQACRERLLHCIGGMSISKSGCFEKEKYK